jgi:hypothetical protein
MGEVSTVGLDIAKSVFQVHGVWRGSDPQARGSREGVGVLLDPTAGATRVNSMTIAWPSPGGDNCSLGGERSADE